MAARTGFIPFALLVSHFSHSRLLSAGARGQGHEGNGSRSGARADAKHCASGGLLALLPPWRHR